MQILIKEVTLVIPGSSDSGSVRDVFIKDGIIQKIETAGSLSIPDAQVIDGKNKFLSSGWFDLHVNFREPGFEHKEDLNSGYQSGHARWLYRCFVYAKHLPSCSFEIRS